MSEVNVQEAPPEMAAEGGDNRTAMMMAIEERDYDKVEETWLELTETARGELDLFYGAADRLAEQGEDERAGLLLLMLAPHFEETEQYREGLKLLRRVARYAPNELDLRRYTNEWFRKAYPDRSDLEECLERAGVTNFGDMTQAFGILDELLCYSVGEHVYHRSGWGVGTIATVNVNGGQITVDFEKAKGRTMSIDLARTRLDRLEEDDLRVLKYTGLDRLRAMADAEPLALVKLVLKQAGKACMSRDLRPWVVDDIIPNEEWTRWWGRVRTEARKDPYLKFENHTLTLRETPMTYEVECLEKVEKIEDFHEKVAAIRTAVKDGGGALLEGPVGEHATEFLKKALQGQYGADPALRVECLFLSEELRYHGLTSLPDRSSAVQALIRDDSGLPALIASIKTLDFKKRALQYAQRVHERWPSIFCEIMRVKTSSDLWDFLAKALVEAGHTEALSAVLGQAISASKNYMELYTWICKNQFTKRWPEDVTKTDSLTLLEGLISLLSSPALRSIGEDAAEALIAKMKNALAGRELGYMKELMVERGTEDIRRLHYLVMSTRVLSNAFKDAVEDLIARTHPDIVADKTQEKQQEKFIMTTDAGLSRREKELEHLLHVELEKVNEQVRKAVSFGDLSENAEYAAALEKQGQIAAKAEQIRDEVSRARVIEPPRVNDQEVSVGTTVTVRDLLANETVQYTILGPWDAEYENRILSYLSPVGAAFLGKKVGDQIQFEAGDNKLELEVLDITRAAV